MCGIGHGLMPAKLFVHSAKDYMAWMNGDLTAQVQNQDDSQGLTKLKVSSR